MKKPLGVVVLMALTACGPDWDEPQITLSAIDHPDVLTSGDADQLFTLRYVCPDNGPRYLVSDMDIEVQQHLGTWVPSYGLSLLLTVDRNRDGKFGPGDEVSVSEKRAVLDAEDVGTYKVVISDTSEIGQPLIGEADWQAQ